MHDHRDMADPSLPLIPDSGLVDAAHEGESAVSSCL